MKKKLIYVLSYIILFFNSNVSSNENNNYLKVGLLAPLSGEYKDRGHLFCIHFNYLKEMAIKMSL